MGNIQCIAHPECCVGDLDNAGVPVTCAPAKRDFAAINLNPPGLVNATNATVPEEPTIVVYGAANSSNLIP